MASQSKDFRLLLAKLFADKRFENFNIYFKC